ncbi:hypothetical protein TCAL_13046 [Tigriopus californicus]|uniref:WAP domain-containing protein n=1 Tax=Tigriopus californicus TaxID=6832 RepID=A0A553P6I3_TIGCA|nr:uncharacterized protein LOC131877662 [Tigriopus californicus]TRY73297.1 hypothetical protein TCAL_13046 [Tigriopus californicus]
MSLSSQQNVALLALFVSVTSSLVLVAGEGNEIPPVENQVKSQKKGLLTSCIDDSDCLKLGEGNKYACFLYVCYPWRDDSKVPEDERRDTCRKDSDCSSDQECHRHHDRRNIVKGLCFDEISECETPNECSEGFGCCGGYCCEQKYYAHFTDLPCVSHLGCRDLGLGQFCCPRDNGTDVCCNTDPNPPTTQAPVRAATGGQSSVVPFHPVAKYALAALLLLAIKF